MEEEFYNDDFEKFLQEQVKHHRMFPSDRIWRNINNRLHKDYRWPALTIATFTFVAAIIAISIYFSPGPNIFSNPAQTNTVPQKQDGASSPLTSVLNNRSKSASVQVLQSNSSSGVVTSQSLEITAAPVVDRQSLQQLASKTFNRFGQATELANRNSVSALIVERNSIDENQNKLVEESISEKTIQKNEGIASDIKSNKEEISTLKLNAELPAIEKAIAVAKPKKGKNNSRFGYQVYITPSASYRKLREDKSTTAQQAINVGGPVGISYVSDVNQVVKHKPGTGMEAGAAVTYNLSNSLKIKTGLQLNARQYSIEAFLTTKEIATIAFSTRSGLDSMTSISPYRISGGYESTELTNRYYQISFPIGLEYEVVGNKNVQLNVAAGVQPTYMISKNAYLISTDFKNYIESPGMTRSWNLNANVETFLSVKSGNYKWQFGPQFRYQTLPTSVKKYPIKEYLIDYGLKIGVSKNLQ